MSGIQDYPKSASSTQQRSQNSRAYGWRGGDLTSRETRRSGVRALYTPKVNLIPMLLIYKSMFAISYKFEVPTTTIHCLSTK